MAKREVEPLASDAMAPKLDPDEIYTLTFDCYGTLIDWKRGVREAVADIESLRDADVDRLILDRERIERDIQRGPYRLYREVLAESLIGAAREQSIEVDPVRARRFAETQAEWPPFDESRSALARLAERFQLAILSNVEDEVLRASVERLGAPFEELVTAEQLRSYKPAPAHFEAALARLGIEKERILHVACSEYHDIRPARGLGFRTAWIDREGRAPQTGSNADLVVPDLTSLAREIVR
jgi:2-haloacid dehalogenase